MGGSGWPCAKFTSAHITCFYTHLDAARVSRPAPGAPLTAFQPYIGQTRPSCDRVFRTPLELPFVIAPCDYLVNLPKPKHFRDSRPANFRRPCPCTSQVLPFPLPAPRTRTFISTTPRPTRCLTTVSGLQFPGRTGYVHQPTNQPYKESTHTGYINDRHR
jgi:hypothetical protein